MRNDNRRLCEKGNVIDVGIHRVADSTRKSGFRLKEMSNLTSSTSTEYITPVGGVGPMTIIGLIMNTLKAFKGEIILNNQYKK